MAGNYDYPRAGNPQLPAPSTPTDQQVAITDRLRHLRELLDSDRQRQQGERQRLAIETLDSELIQMSQEPISARLDRRRRGLEAQLRGIESSDVQASELNRESPDPTSSRTPPISRSRRRLMRPSERWQRYREQVNNPSLAELESLRPGSHPREHTSTLAPLNDRSGMEHSGLLAQEYSGEARVNFDNRWRAKKRKLDSDDTREGFQGFSYGHCGQVVSGRLKMEIASCDGGQYSGSNGDVSWPGHVLQDDSSVYCTKSDRCNLVLRHQGGAPFCLKKLVIKAPRSGFDAAIQQGMVFVSMDQSDLLSRTSAYQIQYSPHCRRRRLGQAQIRLQPSHEYFNSVRSPLRSLDEPYTSSFTPPIQNNADQEEHRRRMHSTRGINPSNYDYSLPTVIRHRADGTISSEYPGPIYNQADLDRNIPRVPDFRVTTEYEDKSDDDTQQCQDSDSDDFEAAAEMEFDRLVSLHDRYLARWGDVADRNSELDRNSSDSEEGWTENVIVAEAERLLHGSNSGDDDYDTAPISQRLRRAPFERRRSRFRRRSTPNRTQIGGHNRLRTHQSRGVAVSVHQSSNAPSVNPHSNSNVPTSAATDSVSSSNQHQQQEMLAPHASFFIRNDKDMVAIKFDPPVSGKYILIKLWAPCPNANIDIQSIIAHGYAGPRFFPAISVR